MTEHNTLEPGRVVVYAEWTGSEYIEHQAYVRAIVGVNSGNDHVEINLSYSDGAGAATPANNVKNIEQITTDETYWRWMHQPEIADSLPPTITRPLRGQIVWIVVYDAVVNDDYKVLAFVRAIPGPPTNQTPDLHLSYYDPVLDDTVNNQNVAPWDGSTGSDHWFDAVLIEV